MRASGVDDVRSRRSVRVARPGARGMATHGTRDLRTVDTRQFRAFRPVLGKRGAAYLLLPFDV